MSETASWVTTRKHFGPAPAEGGFTVWLTGLSGAGKSTIAEILCEELERRGLRWELLDGDVVRLNLSKGLGFSKEDRDTNILRIGWVAERLTYHGAVVVVSAISPYREARERVRQQIPRFAEVYVSCPVEECARRDVKGLYEKAMRGEIEHFTGVSDPYEQPTSPELVFDTETEEPEASARRVVEKLEELGLVEAQVPA